MKTNLNILLIFLLLNLTVLSQTDSTETKYPQTVTINNETVTIFHFWQAKSMLKELTEKDFLESQSKLDSLLILEKDKQISYYTLITSNFETDLLNRDKIIYLKNDVISIYKEEIKEYEKKDKKRKIRNWSLITIGAGGLLTAIILK
jgi:hypothetical protein